MKALLKSYLGALLLGAGLLVSAGSHASVTILGTRIIFPASKHETTVQLNNVGKQPALLQMWLDDGHPLVSPDSVKVPFVVSPPLLRVEPGKGGVVRVVYSGEPLPTDRETVFWFNMLEIPPKTADEGKNVLKLALRTRIKLFFRPDGLPGSPQEAIDGLRWSVAQDGNAWAIKVANDSAYNVSLGRGMTLHANGKAFVVDTGDGLIQPHGSRSFPVKDLSGPLPASATLEASAVNDFGAIQRLKPKLTQ